MTEAEYQAKLTEFATLETGWHEGKSAAITPESIAIARQFGPDNCRIRFTPFPTFDGGVQIEAHQDGYDMEFEIRPDGRHCACWIDTFEPAVVNVAEFIRTITE